MRYHLIAVGRMRPGPERTLFDHFSARLNRALEVREVEEKRLLPVKKLKMREAELLLAALPDAVRVVALDERGRALGSVQFAETLGRWRDDGVRGVAFVIGGANGLERSVLERADMVLSLGAMTWPHMLVRGLLAEQIYRANAILSGHPYHRE